MLPRGGYGRIGEAFVYSIPNIERGDTNMIPAFARFE